MIEVSVTAAIVAAILFIFHDPPGGYNSGTGDSWGPFWMCVLIAVLSGLVALLNG